MAEAAAAPADSAPDLEGPEFIKLLGLAAIVGLIVSTAAWLFLELVNIVQDGLYDDLPDALGFDHAPSWWAVPILIISGFAVAGAIVRLPGNGGHIPVRGLDATPSVPADIPGVFLAAVAGIGFGIVLGPEAPLIGLGGALGALCFKLAARDGPPEAGQLIASSGIFAGISFLFGSPVLAAVLLIEVAGLDRAKTTLMLIPGLLAAGIGSLVAVGLGSWTGVDESAISLQFLTLPEFPRPTLVDFLWTVPLAALLAIGVHLIVRIGRRVEPRAISRPFVVLPVVGAAVGVLALVFGELSDHGFKNVLFSGQDSIGPIVADQANWSLGALALLLALKGIAYGLSLGSFRGGPVFPALMLGGAAGIMASHLPGFDLAPAVAVGMGAGVVSMLRIPLSSVILAVLLCSSAGVAGIGPLVIVGVVVALLVTMALPDPATAEAGSAAGADPAPTPAPG